MPENQLPPTWGPAYDERDLDALLSGDTASLPDALLPLAGTLATLHARPARAELAGEADARAVFRRFAQDAGSWAPGAEYGTVPHTLVLHPPQDDRAQRHTPRHRRRRAGGGLHRPMTIVAGAAAAVVVVAGVALAGLLPGPIRHLSPWHLTGSPSGVATGTAQGSEAPSVDGSASKEPVIPSTPSSTGSPGTATDPGTLCREYYAFFFGHPKSNSAWAEEVAILQQLDALAGGKWKVLGYCRTYVGFGPWGNQGTTGIPPRGNNPGPSGNTGNSDNGSAGQTGDGSTGSGSGPGQQSHDNPAATTAPHPGVSDSQRQTPGPF